MTMEDAATRVLTMGATLGALTFPAVYVFKASTKIRGWVTTIVAMAFCAMSAYCFWPWVTKQDWGLNILACIVGLGAATGADRGLDKWLRKSQ